MTEPKKRPEPASPNYHTRMMNVQMPADETLHHGYKQGHRDARHQCAEIANEADLRIERLEAALREAILEHDDQADNWAYIEDDQNAKYHRERAATLRKALQ